MREGDNELKGEPLDVKMVAEAVRSARLLDPVLRKRWLTLLPHMQAEELHELWSILTESEEQLDQLDAQVKTSD